MKLPPLSVALIAAAQACASAAHRPGLPGSAQAMALTPASAEDVEVFWVGRDPPCGVIRMDEVSAGSERGLREAAYQRGAQVVVGVRSHLPPPSQERQRPWMTRPLPQRVYLGTAAVYRDGRCRA